MSVPIYKRTISLFSVLALLGMLAPASTYAADIRASFAGIGSGNVGRTISSTYTPSLTNPFSRRGDVSEPAGNTNAGVTGEDGEDEASQPAADADSGGQIVEGEDGASGFDPDTTASQDTAGYGAGPDTTASQDSAGYGAGNNGGATSGNGGDGGRGERGGSVKTGGTTTVVNTVNSANTVIILISLLTR